MKKWLVASGWWLTAPLTVVMVGMAPAAYAQKSYWGSPNDPLVKEIVAKEKMWLQADCTHQPDLKDVIADDYQGTTTEGQRIDKAGALADDENWPDHDCQLGPVKVKFFGEDLAVAYGSESMMRKGSDGQVTKRCLVWTDTWLKRTGKWQIIASQDNRVKCQ
jgi:hypothetical protein